MLNEHYIMSDCEIKLNRDEEVFFEFDGLINQNKIIEIVTYLKDKLIKININECKIHHIFEVIIEVMQNMLSYSIDSVDRGNNTYDSRGKIVIIRNIKSEEYSIYGCNIIEVSKKDKIIKNISELSNLNKDELKELYKTTRKNRKTTHKRGAGLGFILIARKASKPLSIDFKEINNNKLLFILKISIEG